MKSFWTDERGLETVEYAIILGLIVVATIGLVATLGGYVRDKFQAVVDTKLEGPAAPPI